MTAIFLIFLVVLIGGSSLLLLLLLIGVIVAPIAALTGRKVQAGQSKYDVITPRYAAMTSMLMLLPYIYLVLRSVGKTPPRGLVMLTYGVLSGAWILGLLITWIMAGVLLPMLAILVILTFGQGSNSESLLPVFILILLGGVAISVLCAVQWWKVRKGFSAFQDVRAELHRQTEKPEHGARLPSGYLRPFVFTTAWTLATALGAPAYAIFQFRIFF